MKNRFAIVLFLTIFSALFKVCESQPEWINGQVILKDGVFITIDKGSNNGVFKESQVKVIDPATNCIIAAGQVIEVSNDSSRASLDNDAPRAGDIIRVQIIPVLPPPTQIGPEISFIENKSGKPNTVVFKVPAGTIIRYKPSYEILDNFKPVEGTPPVLEIKEGENYVIQISRGGTGLAFCCVLYCKGPNEAAAVWPWPNADYDKVFMLSANGPSYELNIELPDNP